MHTDYTCPSRVASNSSLVYDRSQSVAPWAPTGESRYRSQDTGPFTVLEENITESNHRLFIFGWPYIQSQMMATFSNPSENIYENIPNHTPKGYQNPPLNRQMGRTDGYGTVHGSVFSDGSFPPMRFEGGRDPFGALQNHVPGNVHFPYDPAAAQTWSSGSGPFQSFGAPSHGGLGPSRSMKTSRGRNGISNVRHLLPLRHIALTFLVVV